MVAVADDGYYYDFRHITQYIRDNSHTQLLSPRTGEPMSGQVYYVGKCKTTKKPKTMVWTPDIFVREELAETDSDADAGALRGAVPRVRRGRLSAGAVVHGCCRVSVVARVCVCVCVCVCWRIITP